MLFHFLVSFTYFNRENSWREVLFAFSNLHWPFRRSSAWLCVGSPCHRLHFIFEVAKKMIDEAKALYVIYKNLSKALNNVPHDKIKQKTKSNGLYGESIGWIQNWLHQRRQRVLLEGLF